MPSPTNGCGIRASVRGQRRRIFPREEAVPRTGGFPRGFRFRMAFPRRSLPAGPSRPPLLLKGNIYNPRDPQTNAQERMPLPQIRIVSISPYPEMERIVQDVIAAHPQRGRIDNRIITATVDRLDLSELHDCDAIIARGYSARRLKAQGLGVPVIDIAISGYDVIRSIQECQRRFQTRSIGFVGFYNAFNGIEQFSGMFGCDIRVYIPECAAEIRHALELAKQDGCDVIVGGYSVQQDAGLLGLPAILLRTGRETYAQSLEEAIRTVTLVQQERIRTETYKIITESVKDGLLYVDASGSSGWTTRRLPHARRPTQGRAPRNGLPLHEGQLQPGDARLRGNSGRSAQGARRFHHLRLHAGSRQRDRGGRRHQLPERGQGPAARRAHPQKAEQQGTDGQAPPFGHRALQPADRRDHRGRLPLRRRLVQHPDRGRDGDG